MKLLEGRTAFVTGGARGLGKRLVERLAAEGALVGFNYATSTRAAEDIVRDIEAGGGRAFGIQAELGSDTSIADLVQTLDAELGWRQGNNGIDILINNIGGGTFSRIGNTTPDILDQAISVNFRIPFLLTQALMPRLRDDGRVVNISSATVRLAFEEAAPYVCSKAALDTFSRILAKGLGSRGITVNSVGMGRTAGGSNDDYYSDPEKVEQIASVTAMRRVGTEDDVVGVVFALISQDGGWITGQTIDATGGFMI